MLRGDGVRPSRATTTLKAVFGLMAGSPLCSGSGVAAAFPGFRRRDDRLQSVRRGLARFSGRQLAAVPQHLPEGGAVHRDTDRDQALAVCWGEVAGDGGQTL